LLATFVAETNVSLDGATAPFVPAVEVEAGGAEGVALAELALPSAVLVDSEM
jgi:hypothetical protein